MDDDDALPFGRARDYPPSYDDSRHDRATMVDEDEEATAPETLMDELGFEVASAAREAHERRSERRAATRSAQMERVEAYARASVNERAIGGEACAALALVGVHPDHRAEIWAEKLNAHVREYSSDMSFGRYVELGRETMREHEMDVLEGDVRAVCPTHPQLRVDTAETSPSSPSSHAFARLASEGFSRDADSIEGLPQSLKRILIAAGARSPHGYCAAFVVPAVVMLLLTNHDEEASFWMLVGFVEDIVPGVISRTGIHIYGEAKYVDLDVAFREPELMAKCNEADCRPSILAAGLLTRLGLGVLPTETTLRLWDALILEGGHLLPNFTTILLFSLKDKLLAAPISELCETFDAELATLFEVDELIKQTIETSTATKSSFDSLSIRLGEREVSADSLFNLFSFRKTVRSLSQSAGPEGIGRQERITRTDLETLVGLTYELEEFVDVDSAVDKEYQTREMLMAFDLALRHMDDQMDGQKDSLRFDELMKVLRVKSSTSSKLKMMNVRGATVEERMKNFIIGDTNEDVPTEKSVKMALVVANGVIPTQRLSSAPVESTILIDLAKKPNWYGHMRMGARSALILASFNIALFLADDEVATESASGAYDVSIIASRAKGIEDSPRAFSGLAPLPHTEYIILVQTEMGPHLVKKRFSDFKALHETLKKGGCYNIIRVRDDAIGTNAALSVDPRVVATRSVNLQRYLDLLTSCGLGKVQRTVRAFVELDDVPFTTRSRLGKLCCEPLSRVRCDFFGLGRSSRKSYA